MTAPGARLRVTRTSRCPPCGHGAGDHGSTSECSAASELPVTGSRRPNTAKASPECRTHGPRGHHTHCPHRRPRPSQAEGDPREAGVRGGRGCWLGGSGGGGHRGRLWRGCDIVGSCRLTGGQAAGQQALWPLEGRPAKPRGGHAARQHQSQGRRPTGPQLPGQREGHPGDGASTERQGPIACAQQALPLRPGLRRAPGQRQSITRNGHTEQGQDELGQARTPPPTPSEHRGHRART